MLCGGCEGEEPPLFINNALDAATEEPSQQQAGPRESAIDPWTRSTSEPSGLREPTGAARGGQLDRSGEHRGAAPPPLQLLAADAADDLAGLVPSALSSPCLSDIPVKRRITQKSDEAMESEFDTEAANPESV